MTETIHLANQVKKRGTSIFLLIGFGILGVAAYFAGPTVMKYALFFQEQRKHNRINSEIEKLKLPTKGVVSSPEVLPSLQAPSDSGSNLSADPAPAEIKLDAGKAPEQTSNEPSKETPKE